MSSGDEWEDPDRDEYRDDYRDESYDDRDDWSDESAFEERERPVSTGMSTGMKVLIVILCVVGGAALVCCGAAAYLISRVADSFSQDPVVVKQTTREILEIDIPEEFRPMQSISMNIVPMKIAFYERGDHKGTLIVMEMGSQLQPGGPGQEQQMREMLRQQNQDVPNLEIEEENREVREFTIRGEAVEVEFAKATDPDSGQAIHQISTVFDGKQGTIMLLMILQEEVYDETEIEAMLESIR